MLHFYKSEGILVREWLKQIASSKSWNILTFSQVDPKWLILHLPYYNWIYTVEKYQHRLNSHLKTPAVLLYNHKDSEDSTASRKRTVQPCHRLDLRLELVKKAITDKIARFCIWLLLYQLPSHWFDWITLVWICWTTFLKKWRPSVSSFEQFVMLDFCCLKFNCL